MCGKGVEDDQRVIPEADILRALPDIETDLRGPLATIATVHFENLIFNRKPQAGACSWAACSEAISRPIVQLHRGAVSSILGAGSPEERI